MMDQSFMIDVSEVPKYASGINGIFTAKKRISILLDTVRKLNVHKTFRSRPGRLMYVQIMLKATVHRCSSK